MAFVPPGRDHDNTSETFTSGIDSKGSTCDFLSLGTQNVDQIMASIDVFDKVALREACRAMHSHVKVAPDKRRTPHDLCKYAQSLGGSESGLRIARDAGARDLARYAPPGFALDKCREIWTKCFPFTLIRDRAIETRNTIIWLLRADSDAKFSATINATTDKRLGRLGKLASDLELAYISARICACITAHLCVIGSYDNIIRGAARSRRITIATDMLHARFAICPHDVLAISNTTDFQKSGSIELFELANASAIKAGNTVILYYGAMSGSVKMCKYLAGSLSDPLNIFGLLHGGIHSESIEICTFMTNCITTRKCCYRHSKEVPEIMRLDTLGDLSTFMQKAINYSAVRGSRKMYNYFRDQLKALHASQILSTIRAEDTKAACELTELDDAARYRITQMSTRSKINYESAFSRAVDAGAYWMADLICQHAIDDGTPLANIGYGAQKNGTLEAVSVAICGRIIREQLAICPPQITIKCEEEKSAHAPPQDKDSDSDGDSDSDSSGDEAAQ